MTALDFHLANDLFVQLCSGAAYIDMGSPREEDYRLFGIFIRKIRHHRVYAINLAIPTFRKINNLKRDDVPKVIHVPDEELYGADSEILVDMSGNRIVIWSKAFDFNSDPLVLDFKELQQVTKCLDKNEGRFPK